MKKVTSEPSSLPASAENAERGITRRAFLKGTAGFVLLCGSGFGLYGLNEAAKASEEENVGPRLRDGFKIIRTENGAEIAYGGETCFTVNEKGLELLSLADGGHTLEEVIRAAGLEENAGPAADFFLTLGQAGYLQNRLEVSKFAVIM
ncbi:MAG: hypothetical protein IKP22_02135 [Clostridia bacterium]|nr:hypothetical protein [Clostridia bacterium]